MKKILAFAGSLLIFAGLKAQNTPPVKKETQLPPPGLIADSAVANKGAVVSHKDIKAVKDIKLSQDHKLIKDHKMVHDHKVIKEGMKETPAGMKETPIKKTGTVIPKK